MTFPNTLGKEVITDVAESVESVPSLESFYKGIILSARDAMVVIDEFANIIIWNTAAEKLFGWKEGEVIGKNVHDIVAPVHLRDMANHGVKAMQKDGRGAIIGKTVEFQAIHKDGHTIVIELAVSSLMVGETFAAVASIRDVTARKILEQQLNKNKDEIVALVSSMRDILFEVDEDGTFLQCWVADESVLAIPKKELLGKKIGSIFGEDFASHWLLILREVIRTEKSQLVEYSMDIAGAKRTFEAYVNPVFHNDGKSKTISFVSRDVTLLKATEKALREKEKFAVVGTMLQGVSHDLNNVFGGIIGQLELASMDIPMGSKEQSLVNSAIKLAFDGAARLKSISKFTFKNETINFNEVNIKAVIEDTILQAKSLTSKNGVKIVCNYSPFDNVLMMGEIGALRSVFYNLIKNSVEAMPKGGEILINIRLENNEIIVDVIDNGDGMSEETQQKLFLPLFTTKGLDIGRGLGMSSVFTMVKEHQGNIAVKNSELGVGTNLELRFPCIRNKKHSIETKKSTVETLDQFKVLWVDDEIFICETGMQMLKKRRHTGDYAVSGEEALHLLESQQYDLMIVDLGLPDMSGFQLINFVKEKYPEMKIALASGYVSSMTKEEEEFLGKCDFVLEKPFSIFDVFGLFGKMKSVKE